MGNLNALCEHQHNVHIDNNDKLTKFTVCLCGTTWWIVVNDSDQFRYLLFRNFILHLVWPKFGQNTKHGKWEKPNSKPPHKAFEWRKLHSLVQTTNNPIINASNEMFIFSCVSIRLHNSRRFTSQTDTSFGKRFCYFYYFYWTDNSYGYGGCSRTKNMNIQKFFNAFYNFVLWTTNMQMKTSRTLLRLIPWTSKYEIEIHLKWFYCECTLNKLKNIQETRNLYFCDLWCIYEEPKAVSA